MKNTMNKTAKLFLVVLTLTLVSSFVFAQPSGTSITYNSTGAIPESTPGNRTDEGGSITTLVVDALQQNPRWKAYVGNITGTLTLDDASGNTIFNWALDQSSITGEIYASRSNSVSWGDINCTGTMSTIISNEHSALSMSGGAIDSINATFNETTHPAITVGTTTLNNCPATSTFVNSLREAQASAEFPIVLMHDTTNLIYTTPVNPSTTGYTGSDLFDFQMLMANNPASTTTYYFYVELGGG